MGDGPSSGDDGKLSEMFAMGNGPSSGDASKISKVFRMFKLGANGPCPIKRKKHPGRKRAEEKLKKLLGSGVRAAPSDNAIVGNITKLLPANTFLLFQTVAPLATNQGNCGQDEYIMTAVMLFVLACACGVVCFTDTFQHEGKVYHGFVTSAGLWNPSFRGEPALQEFRWYENELGKFYQARTDYKVQKHKFPNKLPKPVRPAELKPTRPYLLGPKYHSGTGQFCLKFTDFVHLVVTLIAFATFTLLTSPVVNCFYPHISPAVVKTTPLLVGFVASSIFAFSPPARNSLAHPLPPVLVNPKAPDPTGKTGGATVAGGAEGGGGGDSKDPNPPPVGSGEITSATSSAPAPQGPMPQANKFTTTEANALYQPAINSAQQSTQLSGLRQTLNSVGADAASLAAQARAHEGFQLPGSPSPYLAEQPLRQQASLGSPGLLNQNLIQANVLARDGSALYGQGLQSSQRIQNQHWQQGSAVERGLTSQVQTMQQPAIQVAHGLTSLVSRGSHLLNEVPSFMANGHLGNTVAREVGTLLVKGAEHGVGGVKDELWRQRNVVAEDLIARFQQSIQPLAEGLKSLEQQGSQIKGAQDELLKSKAALQQDLNTQLQALREPSTSLAQDFTSTFQQGSQNLYQNLYQPASSVAIDIPSLGQEGSQAFNDVRTHLQRQEGATAQGLNGQFQNLYQPTSAAANDALSVSRQNMDGARGLATGLTQNPQALQRHLSMLAQAGPAAQFQQTVGQIRTDLQNPGAGSTSSPGQQLPAAFDQAEAAPSGLLTRASQNVSNFASHTGDEVARKQTYLQEGLKEGVNNVVQLSAETAKLSTPAEMRESVSSSSGVDPEIRASSTQVAERVLRGVLASTSQTAEAAADREVEKGKSQQITADVSAGPVSTVAAVTS